MGGDAAQAREVPGQDIEGEGAVAGDRALSLDILTRDLASLRGIAPHLAGFIGRVEAYVATLDRADLARAA